MSRDYDEELSELLRAPSIPLGVIMLRERETLAELGLKNISMQRLGAGNFGEAFRIQFGSEPASVLKFTRDPFELIASLGLEGKGSRHVVPIHKVWAFPDTSGSHGRFLPWYAVHRALLKPLSEKDALLIESMYELYMDDDNNLHFPTPRAHAMRQRWRTLLQDVFESRQMIERAISLLDGIAAGAREMAAIGIDWTDMHAGNMMRDEQNGLRIVDVGYNNPRKDSKLEAPALTVAAAREYAKKQRAA